MASCRYAYWKNSAKVLSRAQWWHGCLFSECNAGLSSHECATPTSQRNGKIVHAKSMQAGLRTAKARQFRGVPCLPEQLALASSNKLDILFAKSPIEVNVYEL